MRLFYALWPDDSTRARLSELQHGLKGRKTRQANLHITLAFLGEQPDSLLPSLQAVLANLAVPEMTLVIDHVAYFTRQRIAWAGMRHVPESLKILQQRLCAELAENGIAFDQRNNFKPHITLARDAAPPVGVNFEPFVWHAREVSLVHSAAEPTGVSYRVLASQYCSASFKEAEDLRRKE